MEFEDRIMTVVALVICAILLAALLPSAINLLNQQLTGKDWGAGYGATDQLDVNGKVIALNLNGTDDTASVAIVRLFPLFTVLGGMGLLVGLVAKKLGYI